MSQNIRGLPKSTFDPLNHAWSSRLSAYKADIALLSEINVNWSTVPHEDSLAVRSKQYWTTTRCQTAWNKHNQSDSTHLRGGTANILIGNVSHQSTLSGSDPTGLGRWSWTLIRGPANRMLLTASAYAPPKTKFSSNTVAGQHVTHLRAQNDDRSAQAAFFEDLGKEIKKWQESKYSIVLGIDANADVESPTFGQWHRSLGLTNPLLQAYGPAPSTYQRGSRPIDAILTSIDVEVTCGGMIAPGDCFNSDHAGIWIDIQSDTLLGKLDLGPRKTPQRLNTANKAALENYLTHYQAHIHRHDLVNRCLALVRLAWRDGWSDSCATLIEEIDACRVSGMLQAESTCRKLRTGTIPWTPELSQALWDKRYAALTLKKAQGGYVSRNTIRRARDQASKEAVESICNGKAHEVLL